MKTFLRAGTYVLLVVGLTAGSTAFAGSVAAHLKQSDEWFRGDEARLIAQNILSWQSPAGSWPKNTDTTVLFTGKRETLQGTFDNGATTDELRYLARMMEAPAPGSARLYSTAFARGLAHILNAQYANGGWPQYYPPPKDKYHRHITFNDNAMVRLMIFLREVATENRFSFVERRQRQAAQRAFDGGIDCILQCQIKVDGKLTAWCAQHDEIDFSPRPARTYELVSLSGSESVGLVHLLMSLEKPAPEVVRAVDAAVAWFESAKLPGIKVELVEDQTAPKGKNKIVVKDPGAKAMWARFYDIETGKPIFSGRDGVKKDSLAEIESERRNGYAWLGYWPETLLEKDYPDWKRKHQHPAEK